LKASCVGCREEVHLLRIIISKFLFINKWSTSSWYALCS